MDIAKAQKICKLSNEDYTEMLKSILRKLGRKGSCNKTCYLILGMDEFTPGDFSWDVMPRANMPFVSPRKIATFNPYYNFLMGSYPNIAEEVIQNDTNAAYNDTVASLLIKGVDFTLQDDLNDYTGTLALINLIASYGYDIKIFVNKKEIYQKKLQMIKEDAIKMIAHEPLVAADIKVFDVTKFMDMLQRGIISSLTIYDNFISFVFMMEQGIVHSHSHLNPLGKQNDEDFDKKINALQNFIGLYKRFLTPKDLIYLNFLISECIKDFYERIDFSLLCDDMPSR